MKQFNYGIQFKLPETKEELATTMETLKTKMADELTEMNAYGVKGKVIGCNLESSAENSAIVRMQIQDGITDAILTQIISLIHYELYKSYN